jgi:predicted negative regulator of RcsB-dependent stress response
METEEQQVEQLKQFWKEHGKGIVAGLVIGFTLFYGWRYYDAQVIEKQESQSNQYEHIVAQLNADGDEAMVAAQEFVTANDKSTYAHLAALELAAKAVNEQDYATAVSALQSVRDNAAGALKAIADVRQARVLLVQEQYDAAVEAIQATANVEGFKAIAAELRGDILQAKGDITGARAAYQVAVEANPNSMADIKLKSIAAAS